LLKKDSTFDNNSLQKFAINKANIEFQNHKFLYSDAQVKTYTTIGGTPFLDANYTVFGEVIDGLDVIDKIASVKTQADDIPEKPVNFSIKIY
jgi:cyclophilin family peptidyl-prolyl cis-trans isomerase